ncbi:MAG: hypothetical protein ACFCUV_09245 [Rivularia sp. (in: cyanobacteria)]
MGGWGDWETRRLSGWGDGEMGRNNYFINSGATNSQLLTPNS